MPHIPYLFEDKEQVIQTETWYSHLAGDAKAYENCVVKSVTHVKNLRSSVVHEYLQAIIEDTKTEKRTRIVAERQTEQDQVTIGRWSSSGQALARLSGRSSGGSSNFFSSSSSSSSGGGKDVLPLPLYSLKFSGNAFKVVDLAEIFNYTTKAGGKYSVFWKRHCYWFAAKVMDTIQACWPCTRRAWTLATLRGRLLFLGEYWIAKPRAEGFDKEIKSRMEYAPGEAKNSWTWMEAVYKDSIRLLADDDEEADKKIDDDLTELVTADLSNGVTFEAMKDVKQPDALFDDLDVDELYQAVMRDSEGSKYRDLYENSKKRNQVEIAPMPNDDDEVPVPEGYKILSPTEDQSKKMDIILKTMVGSVLAEWEKNHPEEAGKE